MAPDKHPGGRPLKFKTVEILQQKIDEYFGNCDPHEAEHKVVRNGVDGRQYFATEKVITDQVPYTITGLALALDTSRKVLRDYESGKYDDPERSDELNSQFSNTITRAKVRVEQFAEQMLYQKSAATGAIFNLKNNYGWVDESTVLDKTAKEVLDDLDKGNGLEEVAQAAAQEIAKDAEPGPTTQE